ncbi:MAG: aminoglycoside phosphotransferase family protein [Flammeovirgaceae bacterium]|nr:aminoglycoside phosphotransferase family protein [Flammeovirgaceae bacterium]
MIPGEVLEAFSLDQSQLKIEPIDSGHINKTFKLIGDRSYVIQRINKSVFTNPDLIANNLRVASDHVNKNYPGYLFLSTLTTSDGKEMAYDEDEFPWRLFPYIPNTITIDAVADEQQAFRAAQAFGRLSKNLSGVDTTLFSETIPRFHDLGLRYEQFESAFINASQERKNSSHELIENAKTFAFIKTKYEELIQSGKLTLRITHNDTKINNVLFDADSGKAICVIDLDTLMPGYFIYDLGDMVRTFVSPVGEEGKIENVSFRKNIYDALLAGYLGEMNELLTEDERASIPFAGQMMTFMIGLRFLTDHLNGDIYFHVKKPGQNLIRAANQFRLLELLAENVG